MVLISSGQSNAPIQLPEVTVSGGQGRPLNVGTPPPSFDHIASVGNENAGPLIYPVDRPKYFMNFSIFDYSRASLTELGQLTPWSGGTNQIIMPLSEALVDNLQANWVEQPLGLVGKGIEFAFKGIQQSAGFADIKAKINETTDRFGQMTGEQRGAYLRDQLDPKAAASLASDTIGTLTGFAPNKFMTILYIGPEYKTYSFQWQCSPRNRKESERLRQIINAFKKAMSPSVRYVVIWTYPCVFKILFMPNNEQLYKFKPCVLKRFTVNWAPIGRPAFYHGDSPASEDTSATAERVSGNPVEGVTIQAEFLELEYWTQESMSQRPTRALSVGDVFASNN